MSSQTHQKILQRKQQKKENQKRLELELTQINKNKLHTEKKHDVTSMRYKLTPMMEITKSDTLTTHYQDLFKIYQRNNYRFPFHSWGNYMFNPFALILGPLYFVFNRLYMGIFIVLMLMFSIAQSILSLPYTTPLTVYLMGNILCCLTADFFIVHKAVRELDKVIENPKFESEYDILRSIYLRHTKFRVFHGLFGIIFITFILYCAFVILHLVYSEYDSNWITMLLKAFSLSNWQ